MASPATSPSPRAKEFAQTMIRQHGCRYPDRIVIPLSQRELARRLGISPGTLTWYLNELGDAVIARRPLLTLRSELDPISPVAPSTAGGETGSLLEQLIDAVEVNNELLRLTLVELHSGAGDARASRAMGSRDGSETRESVAHSDQKEDKNLLLSGLLSREEAREPVARSRDHSLLESDVEALLEPLEAAVRRCNLVPANDRARLRRALGGYTPEEVAHAVGRIVADIRRGVPIRSPYGLLVHKAEIGDPDYFQVPTRRPAPDRPPAPQPPQEEPLDELDRLAELALIEMDADPARWAEQIADLDRQVEAHVRSSAGGNAETLLRCEPYRRAVRHDLYRSRLAEETETR